MRTHLVLDDALLEQARHLSGLSSTRETVDAALREFVARRQQQEILKLVGQGLIDPAYDVRACGAGSRPSSILQPTPVQHAGFGG